MSATSDRRIFISGVFDMQNFGDLLFPIVAQHFLGSPVQPVAPTSRNPGFSDCLPPISFADMIETMTPRDSMVIGGGHIIHSHPIDLLDQYVEAGVQAWGGSALWYGTTLAAAIADVPVAWNAPGVPHPLPPQSAPLIDAALKASGYVTVRDTGAATLLQNMSDAQITIVPDVIASLAVVWPKADLQAIYAQVLVENDLAAGASTWAIHIRDRSLSGTSPQQLATEIDAISRAQNLVPIFCAVGAAHSDGETAHSVARHLTVPYRVIDQPKSLREIAAVLACSRIYTGASLHGYIVAACYGVPSVLIGRPAYRKFSGFVAHSGREADLVKSWDQAFALMPSRLQETNTPDFPATMMAALDTHWQTLRSTLNDTDAMQAQRAAFLRHHMRTGAIQKSPGWLLAPALSDVAARGYLGRIEKQTP